MNNIKTWYVNTHNDLISSLLDDETTFTDILDALLELRDVSALIGTPDSYVREEIFKELAARLDITFDFVIDLYNLKEKVKVNLL